MSMQINGNFGNFGQVNRPDPGQMKAKIDALLKAGGATDEEIANISGPQDVQTLASKYGISLPAPPQPPSQSQGIQSQSIFGTQNTNNAPPQMNGTPPSGPPPEIVSALQAGGATAEEIAGISGPQDAEAIAAKYNITLPAPPAPPSGLQRKSIFGQ